MTNKIPITKYDPTRVKWYFALFKFLELFGVFLLTFGFYGLGCLVYKYFPGFYNVALMEYSSCTGYFCTWWVGFFAFLDIALRLILVCAVGYLIYLIIKAWIKGNWNLAKRYSEDLNAKAKRLKQQAVEDKKLERHTPNPKRIFHIGDKVQIDCEDLKRDGQIGKVIKVGFLGGCPTVSFIDGKEWFFKSYVTKLK